MTNVQLTALERTGQLSADEVIVKLKDRMAQKSGRIRDNFLRYCKSRRGKLYKKEFRQVGGGGKIVFLELFCGIGEGRGAVNVAQFNKTWFISTYATYVLQTFGVKICIVIAGSMNQASLIKDYVLV